MNVNAVCRQFETELEFPANRATVTDRFGDVVIDAPAVEGSKTVREILSAIDEETYDSAPMLYESIMNGLDDAYIGRKYYDDRAANPPAYGLDVPRDEYNRSF